MPDIAVCGMGSTGQEISSQIITNNKHNLVAAVDTDESLIGENVGDLLNMEDHGIIITDDLQDTIEKGSPDVTVVATASTIPAVEQTISTVVAAGSNVVTTAEELAFPHGKHPEIEDRLDSESKEHNVSIIGTGVNPGFVLDRLPAIVTGACKTVSHIGAVRAVDVTQYDWGIKKLQGTYGFGLPMSEYITKRENGMAPGHIGCSESVYLLADALDIEIDAVEEYHRPLVTDEKIETDTLNLPSNTVNGVRDFACGIVDNVEMLKIETRLGIFDNTEEETRLTIQGVPRFELTFEPAIRSKDGTIGMIYNTLSEIVHAPAGLRNMNELNIPTATTVVS
jgi:4-hydroxy-tetrahydrodipicolinate reductase